LLYLFAQSAFISHIKGTGAKVSPEQFPDLHDRIRNCAEKLQIDEVPDAYILHADGTFNALATRFLFRNFIVLFSDIIDALEDNPNAISFYIGHELTHIKQKHLVWGPFLWPAGLLPLLGAGYSRACESTCDIQGAYCCDSPDDAKRGLCALAVGSERWKSINIDSYLNQVASTSGFWMSFHELTGDYPWLVKRVMRLDGRSNEIPSRNLLAWFLAIFIPRIGFGGGSFITLMIVVAIIGVLAAVAIPSYNDYTARAQVTEAINLVAGLKTCMAEGAESGQWPELADCGYSNNTNNVGKFVQSISCINCGTNKVPVVLIATFKNIGVSKQISGETFAIGSSNGRNWTCGSATATADGLPSDANGNAGATTLENKLLPGACKN
jgi:Tfp pilus assembly major pilin PilA